MRPVVIGVDPGGTTGWCVASYDPEDVAAPPHIIISGQSPDWKGLDGLRFFWDTGTDATFVVEDFRLRAKEAPSLVGDAMIACQVIGVVKYLCEKWNVPVMIRPAGNKVFFDSKVADDGTVGRRRLLTLPCVPDDYKRKSHEWRHALDAINHTLHFLHFDRKIAYH